MLQVAGEVRPRYVSPGFWQRLYLVWIFRNFRTLPEQVLNQRQQRLVAALLRSEEAPLNGQYVIGTVECSLPPKKPAQRHSPGDGLILRHATGGASDSSRAEWSGAAGTDLVQRTRSELRSSPGIASGQKRANTSDGDLLPTKALAVVAGNTRPTARLAAPSGKPAKNRGRIRTWIMVGAALAVLVAWFQMRTLQGVPAVSEGLSQPAPEAVASEPKTSVSPPARPITPDPETDQAAPGNERLSNQHSTKILPAPRRVTSVSRDRGTTTGSPPTKGFYLDSLRPKRVVYPEYPEGSGLTGMVILKVRVGGDGSIAGIQVLSGKRLLADAAVHAVKKWRYKPLPRRSQNRDVSFVKIHFVNADVITVNFAD